MSELKEMMDQARVIVGDGKSLCAMATLTDEDHRAGKQPRYFLALPTELWHAYGESAEECLVELRKQVGCMDQGVQHES